MDALLQSIDLLTGCKLLQLLPMGLGGLVLSSDVVHGMARKEMAANFGFPSWFPTALGLWKISQATMNWVHGGAYTPYAQSMMAFHLGGATYAHAVAEGNPAGAVPCVAFFVVTATAQISYGRLGLGATLALHGALAIAGFIAGYGISALGKRAAKKD
jgi:hypothetical protein